MSAGTKRLLIRVLIYGVVVPIVSWLISLAARNTTVWSNIEAAAMELLSRQLNSSDYMDDVDIAVVDLARVRNVVPAPRGNLPEHQRQITDREILRDVILAIAKNRPLSIGVDVDFSAVPERAYVDGSDPILFSELLALRSGIQFEAGFSSEVPVFLGVGRRAFSTPESWLGAESYRHLAGGIMGYQDFDRRAVIATAYAENPCSDLVSPSWLPSLSARLAWPNHKKQVPPPPLFSSPILRWMVTTETCEPVPGVSGAWVRSAWIDLSPLNHLRSGARFMRPASVGEIEQYGAELEGKIVLVGDASAGAKDQVTVPGYAEPVPGVLIHAASVYTLRDSGRSQARLSGLGVLALDAIMGLLFVAFGWWPTRKGGDNEVLHLVLERRFLLVVIVAFATLAGVLASMTGVLWLDAPFVVVITAFASELICLSGLQARLEAAA